MNKNKIISQLLKVAKELVADTKLGQFEVKVPEYKIDIIGKYIYNKEDEDESVSLGSYYDVSIGEKRYRFSFGFSLKNGEWKLYKTEIIKIGTNRTIVYDKPELSDPLKMHS